MKTWTENHHLYPSKCEGYWRWTLPDSMYHHAPDLLPHEVFHALQSREKHPWLFQTAEDAMHAANLAAEKVGNPSIKQARRREQAK